MQQVRQRMILYSLRPGNNPQIQTDYYNKSDDSQSVLLCRPICKRDNPGKIDIMNTGIIESRSWKNFKKVSGNKKIALAPRLQSNVKYFLKMSKINHVDAR
jgi:hypothetical protein